MTELSPEDRSFLDRFKAWKHRPKVHRPGSETDPTPQQVYDDLMKASFAPALRGVGLKGSGGRFELPSEKYWAQLGFQKSAYSVFAAVERGDVGAVEGGDVFGVKMPRRRGAGRGFVFTVAG